MIVSKHAFYRPRANAVGWFAVGVLVWVVFLAAYGASPYAPFLIQARLPSLHAGMTEPEVWQTLGVQPRRGEGSGPRDDFRMGFRLPFGYGLGMRWDRMSSPTRLNRATLVPPFSHL